MFKTGSGLGLEQELVGSTGPLRDKGSGLELTHPETTALMADLALANGFEPGAVLDPAAGYGNFLYEIAHRATSVRRLAGFELDGQAVSAARSRLWEFVSRGVDLDLQQGDALDAEIEAASFDLVICNPPYVRVHRMSEARIALRERFETAVGRFDLYFLFYELATRALRPGGRLVFISSNKFMTTNSGRALRRLLRESHSPLRVIDFKDASPFKAAVLASILVLEKGGQLQPGIRFVELERTRKASPAEPLSTLATDPTPAFVNVRRLGAEPVVAQVASSEISEWDASDAPWHLGGQQGIATLGLLMGSERTFSDLLPRLSVGIKSTADDVFIRPFDETTAKSGIVERDLLHPLIRGGSIARWRTTWDPTNGYDRYVLYPHRKDARGRTVAVDLAAYPLARSFLELHRSTLASRKYVVDAGRKWYEIWVPQRVDVLQERRKVVFPDFAVRNTFALDFNGSFVGSSAGFGVPIPEAADDDLWYALFLLNSPVFEYLHKRHFGTSILAKRYRYWTRHVAAYPLPWPRSVLRQELAHHARKAFEQNREPSDYGDLVLTAFPLDPSDRQHVAKNVQAWLDSGVTVHQT